MTAPPQSQFYILDANDQPISATSEEWAHWFTRHDRHVAQDRIGKVRISTVFIGINIASGDSSPALWETIIFGGKHDEYQRLYISLVDAREGHLHAVDVVREDG